MFSTILSFLGSAFGAISKAFDFLDKKNLENNIRKGYEEEKRADALEEDKEASNKLEKAKEQLKAAKEAVKAVSKADINDADLTDEQVKVVIDSIEDSEDKKKKEAEIKAAKELKIKKDEAIKKVESNDSFNKGDEISFGG